MAAGAWSVYSNAVLELSNKQMSLSADNYQIILLTSSYSPNLATDTTYGNISANEVANGQGYTTGGMALSGISNTLSSNTVTFSASNPTWAFLGQPFRYGAIVHMAGGSLVSGDLLLCYSDLGGGVNITPSGSFTVTTSGGIFTITHSP